MLKNLGTQTKSLLPLIHKQIANPITRWSNGLRKKPVIAALQELEQFVADLLANQKEPAKLLNIIESIRSDLHQINAGSESIVNLEGAIACPRATDCEVKIYEQIMKLSSSAGNDIFALALHRCIAASIQRQLVYYYSYLPVPEKEWQRIHRLFYEAIQKNISHFVAVDKIYFIGRKLSILNLYSMSLLLGCGRLNHLSTEDISRVFKNMPNWCTLVGISSNPDGSSAFPGVVNSSVVWNPHPGPVNFTTGDGKALTWNSPFPDPKEVFIALNLHANYQGELGFLALNYTWTHHYGNYRGLAMAGTTAQANSNTWGGGSNTTSDWMTSSSV